MLAWFVAFRPSSVTIFGYHLGVYKSQIAGMGSLLKQLISAAQILVSIEPVYNVVFLAVSGDFALEWVDKISENDGPLVIDNSSAFRYVDDVPLVVPEINADVARKSKRRVVANPNCTTAIALMALAPLHKEFGIKRCIMSTYQVRATSGASALIWAASA